MKNLLFSLLLTLFSTHVLLAQAYQPSNSVIDINEYDQGETAISVDPNNPNHIMVVWNDQRNQVTDPGYAFSTNKGLTWNVGLLTPATQELQHGIDPSCSFDNNGTAYYTYIARPSGINPGYIYLQKSNNNGPPWTSHKVSVTNTCDKPYMTIDNNVGSPYENRVYVVYTDFGQMINYNYKLKLRYSTDFGVNWSDEELLDLIQFSEHYFPHYLIGEIPEDSFFKIGAIPIVAPNNNIYITYLRLEYDAVQGGDAYIEFLKSTDGGDSFESTTVTEIDLAWGGQSSIFGKISPSSDPTICVHPDGDIYIAFNQWIDSSYRIYFSKSTDEGETWDGPFILETEYPQDHQFFPWLSCSPEGTIFLNYYQGTPSSFDLYIAELFNSGNEFYTPNYKITSQSSNSIYNNSKNDYLGNFALSKNVVLPVWADLRNENSDVYFTRYETDLRFAYENKSLDHTATSLNGQRKLAKDSNGNYHIVFSSNGEIFTRKSTNDGNSWQAPVRLSDGTGENKFPSIATMDNYLFITWQQYLGLDGNQHKYKIKGVYTSMTGWSPMTINDDEIYFSYPTDPLPVIVAADNIDNNYTSTDGLPEVMIAYSNPDGIYHINLFAWSPESLIYYYSQQGSDHKVPNTSTGYRNPSITVNGLGEIMLTCDYLGNIYAFLTTGGSWSAISSSIFQSAYIFSNTKSSITSDALNYFHISWQGENWVYQTNSILHKKISTSGGIGTPITEFRNNQYMSFQPSTFGHLDANGGVTLYWYTGDDLDIKKVINDGTRWDHSSTEFIPSIQSNARFVNSIDKDLPEDFAYCWTSAGDIPYDCNTCIGCEENQEDFGGSDSIKTFRRAEFSNTALDAILSVQIGNFQLKDNNDNSYPMEPEELDANFTFQNFSDVLNVLFSDSIPRSNLYRKIAFEYEAVIKNLSKIKAINSNDVSLKLKLIDRTTGNTLYTSNSFTLPLDSIKRTISGNLTIPFNRLNQRYDLSVKLILEGVAVDYLNQTENINLVNTYLSGSEYLGKQNETKNNTSKLTDYKLEQNYPNPFNSNTQIKYSVAEDCLVTMKVYDILGREIVVLVNEEKQAGSYSISFDASHLSSGIYFYQVKANHFIDTKKMILLR